eukprot:TRINITY_DN12872_c0_g1_i2.p1 TRINITY_DN12872_c0_g1~~TRINITY_DN12872_c0_g1_i2.p1  ORF type:complete len:197 (+),score=54.54 TRINITY_DN12872_c0_g1_i2:56-646(+)
MSMMERPIAFVCASNNNRSMAAHSLMKQRGYNVDSYGTRSKVKLPGESFDKPNEYDFGTPYKDIYDDLVRKNTALYQNNGLLGILERNFNTKEAPQRWQEEKSKYYDVVICFEERIYDDVVEDLLKRGPMMLKPVHVININVKDNEEEANLGAKRSLEFLEKLDQLKESWEEQILTALEEFASKYRLSYQYCLMYY